MRCTFLGRLAGAWLLASATLAGCKTNPSTGRSQFIVVSPQETAEMGEQAKPELIKEYGGEVPSPQLREYVAQVGRRLTRHVESDYAGTQWEFITLDSDVINAFALPGGKVFMSRGLLQELTSEAALAGVLGHEIGHVTARHIDERISHAMVVQGIAGIGSAATGSASGWVEVIPLIVSATGQGYLLKFGRDQESEADRQGLKYMVKAGYDPTGMEDVMRVLIKASDGHEQWEMLSTHPDPQRRLEEVHALIEADYAYAVNNSQYKKFQNRFDRDALPYLPKRKAEARMGVMAGEAPWWWCAHCRGPQAPGRVPLSKPVSMPAPMPVSRPGSMPVSMPVSMMDD